MIYRSKQDNQRGPIQTWRLEIQSWISKLNSNFMLEHGWRTETSQSLKAFVLRARGPMIFLMLWVISRMCQKSYRSDNWFVVAKCSKPRFFLIICCWLFLLLWGWIHQAIVHPLIRETGLDRRLTTSLLGDVGNQFTGAEIVTQTLYTMYVSSNLPVALSALSELFKIKLISAARRFTERPDGGPLNNSWQKHWNLIWLFMFQWTIRRAAGAPSDLWTALQPLLWASLSFSVYSGVSWTEGASLRKVITR